jgi:hypothetical protein
VDTQGRELYLEVIKEWQELPATKTFILILKAYLYETQCKYVESQTPAQYEYLRGLEIGYARAIEVIEKEMKQQASITMIQVPVIER